MWSRRRTRPQAGGCRTGSRFQAPWPGGRRTRRTGAPVAPCASKTCQRATDSAQVMMAARDNWDTRRIMSSLPLVFSAPRRGQPPRRLADLSAEQRAGAVAALGEKPFRAQQLSRHYFARLSVDAPTMTDIPRPARAALVTELLPPLLTEVRAVSCDNGATSKSLWRA